MATNITPLVMEAIRNCRFQIKCVAIQLVRGINIATPIVSINFKYPISSFILSLFTNVKHCLYGIVLLLFLFVNHSSANAQEHKDITRTKEYQEYEAFAQELKKNTDEKLVFNKENGNAKNTTDIETLLNNSIPNWRNLNTSQGKVNNTNSKEDAKGSIPLVFISFSMPEELIRNYIAEAKLYGGVLVLRGLIGNSLKETVFKLKEIEGVNDGNSTKSNLGVIIHPHLFKLYDIKQVPAIVISKDNLNCVLKYDDCSALYVYDKIYGSVTIEYALEEVKRNGSSSSLKKLAREIISKKKSV